MDLVPDLIKTSYEAFADLETASRSGELAVSHKSLQLELLRKTRQSPVPSRRLMDPRSNLVPDSFVDRNVYLSHE